MCGIAGLIHCGDPGILKKMVSAILHRGPDDEGIEWFPKSNCGLGHTRLSIIDLSPNGHQTMQYANGNLWIT